MKKIVLLGSTGSIGVQTLQVVDMFPDKFEIVALAATGKKRKLLEEQIVKYQPEIVGVLDKDTAKELRRKFGISVLSGSSGINEVASYHKGEIVVSAISGAAGLVPTISAINAGKDIALANKETLVTAGSLVKAEVQKNNVKLLPVDSEHSAIFQCILPGQKVNAKSIILTASGGPFRELGKEQLCNITVKEALRHPTWTMGAKITIDSATMMNKGLEVIEAHWLFDFPYEQIEVLVHPQSIIHSMVRYPYETIIANLGCPDMRIPIQYALTYPERWQNTLKSLDLAKVAKLTFESPDMNRFPCLKLAYEAGKAGNIFPTVLH